MNLDAVAVIVWLCGLAVAIGWGRWPRPHDVALPPELRSARLVYAEHLFRSPGPVLLTAKVDRVYRNAGGMLVLVELKTRLAHRAYRSDVIELSAQRFALSGQTGESVADHAYVLTEQADGRQTECHRVRLMESVDLIALVERREQLLAAKTEPQPSCAPGMCRKCAFTRACQVRK